MTINDKRDALKARYGPIIRGEYVDHMSDHQVYAIYQRLIDKRDPFIDNPMKSKKPQHYEQLRMDI